MIVLASCEISFLKVENKYLISMIENNALVNSASDLWQPTFFDILDDILSLCCFFGTPSIGVDERHQYGKTEQINVKIEVSATQSNF